MPVIKTNQPQRGIRSAAFNFEDMGQQAQAYLERVRVQAQEIVAEAQRQAGSICKQAEEQGRAEGRRAIDQLVEQQVGRQMETLLPALREAITGLQQARQAWLVHWEQRAVHLAAAMAARVVRRELRQAPEITVDLVRESLELAAGSSSLRVLLNPADYEALGSQVRKIIEELNRVAPAELVADATISPGGCRIETRHGAIDQQFETQLDRIEAELT
jgi:flagellar assembly protein FliH